MKGDPLKLRELCPRWEECLNSLEGEFQSQEEAEAYLAYNHCCGCIYCVLLRHKVGCGDECEVRQRYPQYRDDEAMFNLAVSWDPEEVADDLVEQGVEPTLENVLEEGIKRQIAETLRLRKLIEKEGASE